jgi:hypothetical protein
MKNLFTAIVLLGSTMMIQAQTATGQTDQTPAAAVNESDRYYNNDKTPTQPYQYTPAPTPTPTSTPSQSGYGYGTGETETPAPAMNDDDRSSGKTSQQ